MQANKLTYVSSLLDGPALHFLNDQHCHDGLQMLNGVKVVQICFAPENQLIKAIPF